MSSAPKTERLLNLLIMLLVQRHFVSKDRIRAILYADASDDAFEKMFERDKEELRSLGVPIEVGQMDAVLRRRARIPHPSRRVRAPRDHPGVRRGRRRRARHEGLGARPARGGDDRRRQQAHRGRHRPRPRSPRHRPAAAHRRRAVVRRLLGGDPGPPRPSPSTIGDPGTTPRSPATSSRGASSASPAGGTPWASTPTAARSGCSASRASSGRPGRPAAPARSTSPPAPTSARWPDGSPRPRPTEEAVVLVRPGAAAVLREPPPPWSRDVAGPDDGDAVGPAYGCPVAPRRTSCSLSAPTCTSSGLRRSATRSWHGCGRPPEVRT